MAWLCIRNDDYRNSQMCIITGPNQDIAIKLIKRMKGLFDSIEKEPEDSCIYKRILLDYIYGLDGIYTKESIRFRYTVKEEDSDQEKYLDL